MVLALVSSVTIELNSAVFKVLGHCVVYLQDHR